MVDPAQICRLGALPALKTLKLTGNGLTSLPAETTRPIPLTSEDEILTKTKEQFAALECLFLDDNDLDDSVFPVLGRLRLLKTLNLDKNRIDFVPYLIMERGTCVRDKTAKTEKGRGATTGTAGDKAASAPIIRYRLKSSIRPMVGEILSACVLLDACVSV